MGLTVTTIVPRTVVGPLSQSVIKVVPDSSHASGGEALDLSSYASVNVYGVVPLGPAASSGYVAEPILGTEATGGGYPKASVKLDFKFADYDAVADGALITAATADLSSAAFYFLILAD